MACLFSRRAADFVQFVRRSLGLTQSAVPVSGRCKHVVAQGETVEKISRMILGDERFAGLIITINRAKIIVDRRGVAFTEPGTAIELPDQEELRIYRENFLLQRRKSSRPKVAVNKSYLDSIAIDAVEPFTFELKDDGIVTELSRACRIYTGEQGPIGTQFSVKLQAAFHNGYLTIAAYESVLGRTRRITFSPDGSCSQLDVDLPSDVAIEMAKRDFQRNWKRYYDTYFLTPASVGSYRQAGAVMEFADF
jgi:hypothetical protein